MFNVVHVMAAKDNIEGIVRSVDAADIHFLNDMGIQKVGGQIFQPRYPL